VKRIEKHAGVLVALLAVVTAALGSLSAYLKVKADTAVDTRQEVQVRATDLQSDKSSLQKQIAALREENDNLTAQLKTEPAPTASDSPTAVTRDLKVPISGNGSNEYITLDDGTVTQCCSGDFIYARQESTGEPELRAYSGSTPYSIDVSSAGVTPEECSDAVTRSPAAAPVRNLHAGTLICINTNGGTSLLRVVAAPARDGSLRLRQRFWPKEH